MPEKFLDRLKATIENATPKRIRKLLDRQTPREKDYDLRQHNPNFQARIINDHPVNRPPIEEPQAEVLQSGTVDKAKATLLHALELFRKTGNLPADANIERELRTDFDRRTLEIRDIKRTEYQMLSARISAMDSQPNQARYRLALEELFSGDQIIDDDDGVSQPTEIAKTPDTKPSSPPRVREPDRSEGRSFLSHETREKVQKNCILLSEQLNALNTEINNKIGMSGNSSEKASLTRQKQFIEGLIRKITQFNANSTDSDFPVTNPQVFRESYFSQSDNDVAMNAFTVSENLEKMLRSTNGKIKVRAETDPSRGYAFDNHAILVVEVFA